MTIRRFPPLDLADDNGLLAVGGDLEIESLLLAYRSGIFPWPLDEELLAWFAPPQRAILKLKNLHMPHSLRRAERRADLSFAFDQNFEQVIAACAELKNRGKQAGTWITPAMIEAYIALHRAGYAHSVEAYENGQLAGGLYGVGIGGFFAGESMFYRTPNSSKLALCYLVRHLAAQGVEWIDCQVMTPHLKMLGAQEVSRKQYMRLLTHALAGDPPCFDAAPVIALPDPEV